MSGNFPEIFRRNSGNFPEFFRRNSGSFPEIFRKCSGTFPEHFRNFSGKVPEHFRKFSGKKLIPFLGGNGNWMFYGRRAPERIFLLVYLISGRRFKLLPTFPSSVCPVRSVRPSVRCRPSRPSVPSVRPSMVGNNPGQWGAKNPGLDN